MDRGDMEEQHDPLLPSTHSSSAEDDDARSGGTGDEQQPNARNAVGRQKRHKKSSAVSASSHTKSKEAAGSSRTVVQSREGRSNGADVDDEDTGEAADSSASGQSTPAASKRAFLRDISEVASQLDLPVASLIRPLVELQQRSAALAAQADSDGLGPSSLSKAALSQPLPHAVGSARLADAAGGSEAAPLEPSQSRTYESTRASGLASASLALPRHIKISLSSQDVERLLSDDDEAQRRAEGNATPLPGASSAAAVTSSSSIADSPSVKGGSARTVVYVSSSQPDETDSLPTSSARSIPTHAFAPSKGVDDGVLRSGPLSLPTATRGKKGSAEKSSDASSATGPGTERPATAPPTAGSKRVGFAASEVQHVHVYEVDNSLFISIQYARPFFGWLVLTLAVLLGSASDVVNVYHMAQNDAAAYVYATWSAFGFLVLAAMALPAWLLSVRMSKAEAAFLSSREGLLLVVTCGVVAALAKLAQQATAHITQEWRWLSLTAVHPVLIVLFGKLFRNVVFLEEAVGSAVMLVGFVIALLGIDTALDRWPFAEIVALSQGIYIASFLFLVVKLRGKRVSIVIILSAVALILALMQAGVSLATGQNFAVHTSSGLGVFSFLQNDRFGSWILESLCFSLSFVCYLMTLKFIPPLTVSAAMCIQVMVSHLSAYMLLFNASTALWNLCPDASSDASGVTPPYLPPGFGTPSPSGASRTVELSLYCDGAGQNAASTRNTLFAVGSVLCVFAAGYLVYVSSIKRSKVDLLLRHLSHRKTPRNPYEKKSVQPEDGSRDGGQFLRKGGSRGGAAPASTPSLVRRFASDARRKRQRGNDSVNDNASLHTISGGSSLEGDGAIARREPPRRESNDRSGSDSASSSGASDREGSAGAAVVAQRRRAAAANAAELGSPALQRSSDGGTSPARGDSPTAGQARRSPGAAAKRSSGLKVIVHKTTGLSQQQPKRNSSPPQPTTIGSSHPHAAPQQQGNQLDAYYDDA